MKNDSTGHHINFHAVVLNPASSKLYLYVADIYAAVLLKRLDEWYKQLEDAKPYKNICKTYSIILLYYVYIYIYLSLSLLFLLLLLIIHNIYIYILLLYIDYY